MLKNITLFVYVCVCVCEWEREREREREDSSVSGQVSMADYSEHCKDSAGFINSVEFFEQMNW